jgi:hypothetical protein
MENLTPCCVLLATFAHPSGSRDARQGFGAAFLFGTDAHESGPRDGKAWKVTFKKVFWPFLSPGRPGDCSFHWNFEMVKVSEFRWKDYPYSLPSIMIGGKLKQRW